jgi:hypothetical protein
MTIDQFWGIIEKIHLESGGDMDAKSELLAEELRKLPAPEVRSFGDHFDDCEDRAYTWELWAAAYIIGGGCSDDAFSDFRATLISMGRTAFERAVANPDVLTDMDLDEGSAFYEGFQYPVIETYQEMTGNLPERTKPHPESPSGKDWDEETVAELYPRLAEKHGYS